MESIAEPAFLLAVLLIAVSPGPAVALILRRAAVGGFRAAVPTVLGLEAGLYAWALLAAAGVAGLVAASEAAFWVLRGVGAVVLVWLGVQALRAAWREHRAGRAAAGAGPGPRRGGWAAFGEGVLVQLANPKAAVFMVAFYPQFVPADRPLFATTALLALVQVALETVLYLSLAAGVARAGAWFRRPRVRTWLEGVSGTVLVALGLRVAVSSR
ncbi:LysE family translocator [Geodermatophilus nigrescens]|uniref:Threonine/homoserine/homoserine lactone efflux protein n=1 Tax=Geodermatophilus nigrescens TaxID=1070870 RepID=A0A1M5DI20_9ACTN|nr:LysE family translocator [Geodermatophilus nigrescens]SHF66521.1 Threonine/homoserine/homoserine lactone efflux protein [Geodermatophilus nigrescens]